MSPLCVHFHSQDRLLCPGCFVGIVSCSSQAQHVPQERTQNRLDVADVTVRLQSILRSSGKEVSSAHTQSCLCVRVPAVHRSF